MSVSGFEQDYIRDRRTLPLRARPAGTYAALGIGGAALLVLFGFLVFGKSKTDVAAPEADVAAASIGAPTIRVAVPQPMTFELGAPEFVKEKKAVTTRQLEGSNLREDSLTLGEIGATAPYLRVDIRQSTGDKRASADFFLDLTRHATQAGLSVLKILPPAPFASRFGPFEVGDLRISVAGVDGATTERVCQAMRLAGSKAGVEIAAVVCGTGGKQIDRRALPCFVDRLEYRPTGQSAAMERFFQTAEGERTRSCGGVAQAAVPATAAPATAAKNDIGDLIDAHPAGAASPGAAAKVATPQKSAKKAH
jgi:hypothetical protein